MNAQLKQAFEIETVAAYGHFQAGDPDAAFGHLERAHVLGQRTVAPQVLRIALGALGSAAGVYRPLSDAPIAG